MKTLETTIDIKAPVRTVWTVLTDFAAFPEWSRFIVSITGAPQVGTTVEVHLDDGARPMVVRPRLLAATADTELRWRGVLGVSLVMSGEHYFRLAPLPDGGTRFTHGERFGGLLIPLLWKTLDTRTRRAFTDFNAALQKRAESTRSATA